VDNRYLQIVRENILIPVIIVAIIIFSVLQPPFLSPNNLFAVLKQMSVLAIVSVGICIIIITGEIDLSFAAVLGFCPLVTVLLLPYTGDIVAVVVALMTGLGIGYVNGVFTTKVGVPSFIVTLGMMGLLTGLTNFITRYQALGVRSVFLIDLFGGQVGPLSMPVIWMIIVLLFAYALTRLRYGKRIYATGGDERAARYSGIETKKIKILAFVIMGGLAALGGLIEMGRMEAVRPGMGDYYFLLGLTAPILGGTSLSGGIGTIKGTVLSVLLLILLASGLNMLGFDPAARLIAQGIIFVLAVVLRGRT
jgi:ribose transport system permease protein